MFLTAASFIVGDRSAVDALVFLSSSALFKADLANNLIQTASAGNSPQSDSACKTTSMSAAPTIAGVKAVTTQVDIAPSSGAEVIGQASLSGRVLLLENSMTEKRSVSGSNSKMKASGLMGVPKAGVVAPADAAYDLFFLEKKLAELGLMTGGGSSGHTNNGNSLTSALGESFMLLSNSSSRAKGGVNNLASKITVIPFGTRDSMRVTLPEHLKTQPEVRTPTNDVTVLHKVLNPAYPASVPTPVPLSGPYGGMKKKRGTPAIPPPNGNCNGNRSLGTFWLPNPIDILTWRGVKQAPPLAYLEALHEKPSTEFSMHDSCQFDLNWNDDQSVYGTHTTSQKGEAELKDDSRDVQAVSASAIQGYFVSSQSENQLIDYPALISPPTERENHHSSTLKESELRLLQSIKRLGDENFSLLQRIDLLSAVEARNLNLHKEMALFKKEYHERFCRLKEVLREFQKKNAKDGTSHNFGFEFNTVIGTQHIDTLETKKENSLLDPKSGIDDQDNLRQQQLERTVLALVKRLEEVLNIIIFYLQIILQNMLTVFVLIFI